MQIWVDADACPGVIKEILFRAAERAAITTTLVANTLLRTPASRYIRALQVPRGFDVADNEIVQRLQTGDLVITRGYSAGRRCHRKRRPCAQPQRRVLQH